MAYSPLGGRVVRAHLLARIVAAHGCSPAAVPLAWTIPNGTVIAIPETGNVVNVRESAVALSLALTADELHAIRASSIMVVVEHQFASIDG